LPVIITLPKKNPPNEFGLPLCPTTPALPVEKP
jgi:hypothetical protein